MKSEVMKTNVELTLSWNNELKCHQWL